MKTEEQWTQYNDITYKQSSGIEQMGWFYFWPGLEPFPTSGTVASPSNTPEFAQLAYEDYELEFLSPLRRADLLRLVQPVLRRDL